MHSLPAWRRDFSGFRKLLVRHACPWRPAHVTVVTEEAMMNDRANVGRRAWPAAARTAAAIATATAIAACGSSPHRPPSARGRTNPNPVQAQHDTLNFARCMRSHGVPNFPDNLNFQNVPGINPSSPAFKTAQTACQHLLPVKSPPPAAPSAQTHAKLLRLANCLRAHGYPSIPDPKPNPPPPGGSSEANRYDALYGEGDYWIGIPNSIDAHGAAFVRTARACGATGVGP